MQTVKVLIIGAISRFTHSIDFPIYYMMSLFFILLETGNELSCCRLLGHTKYIHLDIVPRKHVFKIYCTVVVTSKPMYIFYLNVNETTLFHIVYRYHTVNIFYVTSNIYVYWYINIDYVK